jgi:hypothetical protein
MGEFDHLDIMMKMLEVLERNIVATQRKFSQQELTKATTIIERMEGTLFVNIGREVTVEGDKFENISNSVIATRGSIAKGIITVRERGKEDIAEAIQSLEKALSGATIPEKTRQEALELLNGITEHAASERPSKGVMKSLGETLMKTLENVGSIADVVGKAWPIIASLWA